MPRKINDIHCIDKSQNMELHLTKTILIANAEYNCESASCLYPKCTKVLSVISLFA